MDNTPKEPFNEAVELTEAYKTIAALELKVLELERNVATAEAALIEALPNTTEGTHLKQAITTCRDYPYVAVLWSNKVIMFDINKAYLCNNNKAIRIYYNSMTKYIDDKVSYTFSKVIASSTAPLAYSYVLPVTNGMEIVPISYEQYKSFDNSEILSNLWHAVKTFFNNDEN